MPFASARRKPTLAEAFAKFDARGDDIGQISLYDFVPRISPRFQSPRHLAPLVGLFDAIEREPVRACVSVPPRHSKTETVLHGIARLLRQHPDWTVAYVSYAADIARSKSRQLRDYARAAGVQLRNDSAALHEWRTPEGGGVLATGVGGPLTGHGVRLLVVDDPFKNREEADSPIIRQKVYDWFTSTGMTRVEPGGSVLVVHTRWHRDDLIGRLSRDDEVPWNVINLPAIDPRREGDGSLWPERWPREALEQRMREVGEYDAQSLYQGAPIAKRGRVYSAFTQATHVLPHREIERLYRQGNAWTFRRVVIPIDWGYSDPCAVLSLGVTATGRIVVFAEQYERNVIVDDRGWLARFVAIRDELRPYSFIADPSEPGYIAATRNALKGRPVVENAINDIADGIRRVQIAMQGQPDGMPGLIISDRCVNLIRELETHTYKVGPDGQPSDTPAAGNDHALDALRYGVAAVTRFQ